MEHTKKIMLIRQTLLLFLVFTMFFSNLPNAFAIEDELEEQWLIKQMEKLSEPANEESTDGVNEDVPSGDTSGHEAIPLDEGINYIRDYDVFLAELRKGAAERKNPFILYVIETAETKGKIAKIDYFDFTEHIGDPFCGDALRWEIYSPFTVNKTLIAETGEEKAYKCEIVLGYRTNAEQEQEVQKKIADVIASLGITDSMSDYEKTRLIYDYICKNVKYGYPVSNSSSIAHTSYAALIKGKAVCQGYSVLLYKMFNYVGVDSRIIAGDRNGEAHGWNIVKIDNDYYCLDATWDAGKSSNNSDSFSYDYTYFLRGTDFFKSMGYEPYSIYQNIVDSYSVSVTDSKHRVCEFNEVLLLTSPSCVEGGVAAIKCSCGVIQNRELPAIGHDFGDWVVTKEVSEMENGEKIRNCRNEGCGVSEIEIIPATHSHVYIHSTIRPTCTEEGYTKQACYCGDMRKTNFVEATGHLWGKWEFSDEVNALIRICSVCSEIETEAEAQPMLSKNVHKCRNENKIEGEYGCGVCGGIKNKTKTLVEILENHMKNLESNESNEYLNNATNVLNFSASAGCFEIKNVENVKRADLHIHGAECYKMHRLISKIGKIYCVCYR